ncbi:MAG: hypothetical protein HW421_4084, partial [Ignavibacteria bacterium]|nr:hypothetical protein [Ignavibacteria bacterium]
MYEVLIINRILVFLAIAFTFLNYSYPLAAQEPLLKIYWNNGEYNTYNLNDIDSINLIKSNSNYVMKIFYRDSMVAYYPTEVISKIQFDKDSSNNMLLNVYVFGYPTSYKLSD